MVQKLIAPGLGIVAFLAVLIGWGKVREFRGVQKERARVETQGAKIDAKAQAARKRAASDADRVLGRYYRD